MIKYEATPNPNALKFAVGQPVGGPATFAAGQDTDNVMAQQLLALPGVTSIFLTADFVTVSKAPGTDWDEIIAGTTQILSEHFD